MCRQEYISVPIQQWLNFEGPWIFLFKSPNDYYHIHWVIFALSSQLCNNIVMNGEEFGSMYLLADRGFTAWMTETALYNFEITMALVLKFYCKSWSCLLMLTFERSILQRLHLHFIWEMAYTVSNTCIVASTYQGWSFPACNVTAGPVSLTYQTCRLAHWEVLHLFSCSDLRGTQT